MQTCLSEEWTGASVRAGLHIEDMAVDTLLEEVHAAECPAAARRGIGLRVEVIAWEPLVVAADRAALVETLREAARYVLASEEADAGCVTLLAYPTHDEVGVVVEVKNSQPARREDDALDAPAQPLAQARACIRAMGGELTEYQTDEGGVRLYFWLPQWV